MYYFNHVNVRLFWEGTWDISGRKISESIPNSSGIYMILAERRSPEIPSFIEQHDNLRLLYIGESDHLRKSLTESKRWGDWEHFSPGHRLLLKIAKTERLECRRKVASLLTFQNKPLCNTRYNNVAGITCLQLQVTHTGSLQPLRIQTAETEMPETRNKIFA